MTTKTIRAAEITRKWHLIDIKDQILGRGATRIATLLAGKHKSEWSPNLDCGDYVVVINAAAVKVTGEKLGQKIYFRHSGYPGGAKSRTLTEQLARDPRKVIETAVAGMLPKNKLRQGRLRRLKVFAGEEHRYGDKFKT